MRESKLPKSPTPRPRVRRGNAEDADRLREALVAAALQLFAEGGLAAVSLRAVAARVGVSPMAPYRYFADKAELLAGLWQFVIDELLGQLQAAVQRHRGARQRHRALIEAFVDFWQGHPQHFCLVYGFSDLSQDRASKAPISQAPVYARLRELALEVTAALATATGGDPRRAKLAADLRLAMLLGYLHGTMVVTRYPWTPQPELRRAYLTQVESAVEACLAGR